MNVFGEKFRELRKSKGYSLRKLAPMVGVGFSYLSKVECAKLDFGEYPSAALIHRLADVLEADDDELMLLANRIPDSIASKEDCRGHRSFDLGRSGIWGCGGEI